MGVWIFTPNRYIIARTTLLYYTTMTQSLEILPLIMNASLLVKAVMAFLLLLSLLAWLLIFRLSFRLARTKRHDHAFIGRFLANDNIRSHYQSVANEQRVGLSQLFFEGYSEYIRLSPHNPSKADINDALERKFRVGLGRQQAQLEGGLTTLASIASVSPYIGLFGTVWGIMTAFIGIGEAGSVSLATVAPGIAEALIATAMGLFAAIPASLAFNHFSAKSTRLYENRALFCDELTGLVLRHLSGLPS